MKTMHLYSAQRAVRAAVWGSVHVLTIAAGVLCILASTCAHAAIVWTGDWTKTQGFYGAPPFPATLLQKKEAFGASSTLDGQITDTGKMPGIGKTLLGLGRDPLGPASFKVGAVFDRKFTLTEESDVVVSASLNGFFSAVGNGWLGRTFDWANARAVAQVLGADVGSIISVTAYVVTPDFSQAGEGIYPRIDAKSTVGHLDAGDYTFQFTFDSDVYLGQGAGGQSLTANFFNSYAADLTVPEPASSVIWMAVGLAAIIFGCCKKGEVR